MSAYKHPSRVLFIGFESIEQLDAALEDFIQREQCYLFSVLVGGLKSTERRRTVVDAWAEKNGIPLIYKFFYSPEKMIAGLVLEADYLVMWHPEKAPNWQKRLLSEFKRSGKHGKVYR